jgi:ABC-type polysaccharide/polyol phosphate export permease
VVYPLSAVPEDLRGLYLLNPIALLVESFRNTVIGGQSPDLAAIGLLAVASVVCLFLAQRLFSVFDAVLADVI